MKHIRLFENEEPGLIERYRELHELGLIGTLDYYRDLGREGLDFESYRVIPSPGLRLETNGLDQEWEEALGSGVESLGVSDFGLSLLGDDLTNRVEAVFPNGDLVSYLWSGQLDRLRRAEVNGRPIGRDDLEAVSRSALSPFWSPDSDQPLALVELTVALLSELRPIPA